MNSQYVGRFAPSPSGPLHFGSLVAAVASYLDAKANNGKWLVRIEDIDPPREQKGARALILQSLDVYGLHHDEEIILQSHRLEKYQQGLNTLKDKGLIYPCSCTRKRLARQQSVCTGQCYQGKTPTTPYTLRLKCPATSWRFVDRIYDLQTGHFSTIGNCILLRKDGLFAYQLAVVIDDIEQNITHVIRGADLLSSTPWQLLLFKILSNTTPRFGHIPLVLDAHGNKLSKQHFAKAISLDKPEETLFKALQFLQLSPEKHLSKASIREQLHWGIAHWKLPKKKAP